MQPITPAIIDLMERMVDKKSELAGETIKAVKFTSRFGTGYQILMFDGGKWAMFSARHYDDDTTAVEMLGWGDFDMTHLAALTHLGICTKEEHDAEYAEQKAKWAEQQRRHDLLHARLLLDRYPELRAEILAEVTQE